jgi:hypothetical protein
MRKIEHEVRLAIGQRRIVTAFFEPQDLRSWWGATRAITEAQPTGLYLVEWEPGDADGGGSPPPGLLAGVVREFDATRGFTVDSCYWIPRGRSPLGPVRWSVDIESKINLSIVRVEQETFRPGDDPDRVARALAEGWPAWLESLQSHLT